MTHQDPLWAEPRPSIPHGEVRKALDRSLKAAKAAGSDFLDVEVAALRRQANDLDRLERLVQSKGAKTWDYTPKTAAHAAFSEAVARVFGRDRDAGGDAFDRRLDDFLRAEADRSAQGGEPSH